MPSAPGAKHEKKVQKKPIGLDRLVADPKPAAAAPAAEGWGDDDDLDLDNL